MADIPGMSKPTIKHNIIESLLPLAVDIHTLIPDPHNARLHPEPNLQAIQASLEYYGQRKPIVVNSQTKTIEAGNGLYQAAVNLGWTKIAAVFVDDDSGMAQGYAIMDNQSALLAEWDLPVLKDLLIEMDTGAFDMKLTGFDEAAIEDLMTQVHPVRDTPASQGYYNAEDAISWTKLAHRLELVSFCQHGKALELYAGQGRLSWWYRRQFASVITVDKQAYAGIDFQQTAKSFIQQNELREYDFIDVDDEGCPSDELRLLFAKIKPTHPVGIAVTDGNGLHLKRSVLDERAKNLEKYYDFTGKAEAFFDWDSIFKGFIESQLKKNGLTWREVSFYRLPNGNVIYACYLVGV